MDILQEWLDVCLHVCLPMASVLPVKLSSSQLVSFLTITFLIFLPIPLETGSFVALS